jgi:hypothetical protein
MLQVKKNQVWDRLYKLFGRVADGLGKEIDPGIMNIVVALNATGIRTRASCEGHLHRAEAYPWIDIECPQADRLEQEILACLDQDYRLGGQRSQKSKGLLRKHRSLLIEEEQKLVALLSTFYRVHPMDYDRHLIISRFAKGEVRMQSHGAEYQEFRDRYERAAKLKEYQQEMQDFAQFLKEYFDTK